MKHSSWLGLLFLVCSVGLVGCGQRGTSTQASVESPKPTKATATALAGSKNCRMCHADFYKLWSTSRHGLAMQPYTAAFAKASLTPQAERHRDRATQVPCGDRPGGGLRAADPARAANANTPSRRSWAARTSTTSLRRWIAGRLQVLPLAYDVHKKAWYDMAASGVRHFPDRRDEALDWTDRMFTFNTTCFNCHVTELATNYDLATDTYHTTWSEPGISCESCHGSGQRARPRDGGRRARAAFRKTLRSFAPRSSPHAQMNDMCATCHAKLVPLSLSFRPGDKFFDHFDLVTLEHRRFLSRRPRPGRELHVYVVADEPVRQVGQARLQPLPHAQRPVAFCRARRRISRACRATPTR